MQKEVDVYVHHIPRMPGSPLRARRIPTLVFLLGAVVVLLAGCSMPGRSAPADGGDSADTPSADSTDDDSTPDQDWDAVTPVLSPNETTGVETGPVRIEIQEIYWLELDDYYTPLNNSVAIDVRVTNLSDRAVDYSGMYSWGVMVTDEGEQIETTEWFGAANAQYFDGYTIAAGAFIRDTISFDELPADSNPESFQFKADPPFDGAQEFEVHFEVGEVGTKSGR